MRRLTYAIIAALLLTLAAIFPSPAQAMYLSLTYPTHETLYTTGTDSTNLGVYAGVKPYTVTASNGNIKITPVPGTTHMFQITPVSPGKSVVTVKDANGAIATQEFTIASPFKYTVSTSSPSVGEKMTVTLSGGIPPYTLKVINQNTATVTALSATAFEVVPKDTTVDLDAHDAKRGSMLIRITAKAQTAFTAPLKSYLSIGQIDVGQDTSLNVSGGTPPYTITTSNSGVVISPHSPGIYKVTGKAAGTTAINIKDSKGATDTKTIQVRSNAPHLYSIISADTVAVGKYVELKPMGGLPPYQVSASNQLVSISNKGNNVYHVTGVAPGSSSLTITDSAGTKTSVQVKVIASLMQVSVPLQSWTVGSKGEFKVTGGQPTYTVSASNANVTISQASPGVYAFQAVAPGNTEVTVKDSASYTSRFTITVIDVLRVNISSASFAVGEVSTMSVSGGKRPYTATANAGLVRIETVDGLTFRITGVSPGTVGITVRDSQGLNYYRPVTVTPYYKMTANLSRETINVGETALLTIARGTPPFQIIPSTNSIAISPRGTYFFDIRGLSPGASKIIVRDSRGQIAELSIAVVSPQSSQRPELFDYQVTNSTGSKYYIQLGGLQQLKLIGGVKPYSLVAESPQFVQLSQQSPDTFTIRGIRPGSTRIILRDNAGKIIFHPLTVMR